MKRKSNKLDPDFLALKRCCRALDSVTPRMIRPTLEFLTDRYLVNPRKVTEPPKGEAA